MRALGAVLAAVTAGQPVHVTVESARPDRAVELIEVVSDGVVDDLGRPEGIDHRVVCEVPCVRAVDPSRAFYVRGEGLARSRRFTLAGHGQDVALRVLPGRRGLFIGGIVVTLVGTLTVGTGIVVTLREGLHGHTIGPGDEVLASPDLRAELAVLFAGVGMLAGGAVMLGLGRTRVRLGRRGLGLLRPLRF